MLLGMGWHTDHPEVQAVFGPSLFRFPSQICVASCCLCVRCGVRVVCGWCAGRAYEAVAVAGGGPPGESTGKSILAGSALLSASTGG